MKTFGKSLIFRLLFWRYLLDYPNGSEKKPASKEKKMKGQQERTPFAGVYRAARKAAKVNQAQVARACGLTQPAVGKWEKEVSEPSLANLVKVADLLHVSTDFLLGRTQVNAPVSIQGSQNAANIVDSTVQIGGAGERLEAEVLRLTRECERLSRECERLASRNAGR